MNNVIDFAEYRRRREQWRAYTTAWWLPAVCWFVVLAVNFAIWGGIAYALSEL